jgi:hypothetical protein
MVVGTDLICCISEVLIYLGHPSPSQLLDRGLWALVIQCTVYP